MSALAGRAGRRMQAAAALTTALLCCSVYDATSVHAAVAEETAPGPRRVNVVLEFLAVQDGSRSIARRREILEVGMQASVDETVVRRGPGGAMRSRCRLAFTTAEAEDDRVRLDVVSVVEDNRWPDGWRRERRLELSLGTSSLVEIAPQEEGHEGLVVSITLERAGLQKLTAVPVAVELLVGVYVVDGKREMTLKQPRLRTLAGSPASFSFDYPVPASEDGGVDHVRFDVRVTPSHPHGQVLPVRLELDGQFPEADGAQTVERDESRELAPGQRWLVPIRAREEDETGLRLEIAAFWRVLSPGS